MNTFQLKIVTPIAVISHESVDYIRCPGIDGSFGIMANHQKGIFALNIGEIKLNINNSNQYLATGGGFAEIMDGKVKLLVESIEKSLDIDIDRAKNSLDRAQTRKLDKKDTIIDEARVEASIFRAINRLKISKR